MNYLLAFEGGFELFKGFSWQNELIYLFRIVIAGLLGLIIGIERSHRQKRQAWELTLQWVWLRRCLR